MSIIHVICWDNYGVSFLVRLSCLAFGNYSACISRAPYSGLLKMATAYLIEAKSVKYISQSVSFLTGEQVSQAVHLIHEKCFQEMKRGCPLSRCTSVWWVDEYGSTWPLLITWLKYKCFTKEKYLIFAKGLCPPASNHDYWIGIWPRAILIASLLTVSWHRPTKWSPMAGFDDVEFIDNLPPLRSDLLFI